MSKKSQAADDQCIYPNLVKTANRVILRRARDFSSQSSPSLIGLALSHHGPFSCSTKPLLCSVLGGYRARKQPSGVSILPLTPSLVFSPNATHPNEPDKNFWKPFGLVSSSLSAPSCLSNVIPQQATPPRSPCSVHEPPFWSTSSWLHVLVSYRQRPYPALRRCMGLQKREEKLFIASSLTWQTPHSGGCNAYTNRQFIGAEQLCCQLTKHHLVGKAHWTARANSQR
jgi:hypothetical protein